MKCNIASLVNPIWAKKTTHLLQTRIWNIYAILLRGKMEDPLGSIWWSVQHMIWATKHGREILRYCGDPSLVIFVSTIWDLVCITNRYFLLKSGPPQYCSRTVYENATPELVRDFFWDDDFRLKWDNMLTHASILEECPTTGIMVVHWIRKVGNNLFLFSSLRCCGFFIHFFCTIEVWPFSCSSLSSAVTENT